MAKLNQATVFMLVFPILVLSAPQQTFFSLLKQQLAKSPVTEPVSSVIERWDLCSISNSSFHEEYHQLPDTHEFLSELQRAYPDLVTLEDVGHSAEGRQIVAAAISRPQLKRSGRKYKKKPRFLVLGAQHAREWIATSTALYLSHALVVNASEPGSITDLLDLFDFHIIPTPNPDGYQYTWEVDRFWYKNRMPVRGNTECKGVDMNRNWGFEWEPSSSQNEGPCAAWYPGTRPYQAPEVHALANYISKIKRIKVFVDLRNFGQMISTPFSYSCDMIPRDAEDQLEAAVGAAAALHSMHGTFMKTGMLCGTLYSAPGNIVDWMYAERGIKYSYAVHLRDTGTYGFDLPTHWIKPVGEETASMVSYLADFISKQLNRKKKKP